MDKKDTKIPYVCILGLCAAFLGGLQLYQAVARGVEVDPMEILSVLPEDAIRSIDNPKFVSGEKADKQMREDEPVIGLKMNSEMKAYPLYVLSAHEIVNDVIAEKHIAVTW
ncbi:MAG: DUF3179 domain-containing protein [Candidatus Brocadiales bacterium]|nr:DUF3179 domain-containing protein [Candidatus Bathyanammoxibius sp.]